MDEAPSRVKAGVGAITLAYRGASARPSAEALCGELGASGVGAPTLTELPEDLALGSGEIIITILVTAAAKAVITVALKQIEKYITTHLPGETLDVQVVLQRPEEPRGKRFPLRLRQATSQVVQAFFDDIQQMVSKL